MAEPYSVPEHTRTVDALEIGNDGKKVLVVRHVFYGYSPERAKEVEDAHRESDEFFEASLSSHRFRGFEVTSARPLGVEKKVPPLSDSLLEAYREHAGRMHGSAGEEIGDEVDRPTGAEMVGETGDARVWRIEDGWGEFYFADPKKSGDAAEFVACKMPDVMAMDVAPKYEKMIEYKELGMGDEAWDAAVLAAVGGKGGD